MLNASRGPWPDPVSASATDGVARGWYLYGVTRNGHLAAVLAELEVTTQPGDTAPVVSGEAGPVQLFEFSGLAAVVRPVFLSDFSPAVVRERLQDASALEETVRSHNRVVEAIHAAQAILPAKFGMVYSRTEDVVSALQPEHNAFLEQLARVEGCDEWAIHLFANAAVVQQRISTEDPDVQRLRLQHASARPGRAYFLERQLADAVKAATRQQLVICAQNVFDQLMTRAVAGHMSPMGPTPDGDGEMEILRASFLVARDLTDGFTAEVAAIAESSEGLRCESSGPWPPYSFAATDVEELA